MADAPWPAFVDWALAERVARRLAARAPHAPPEALARIREDAAELAPLADRLVREATGLQPPGPAHVQVVDRPAWIRANVESFRVLLEPILERLGERRHSLPSVAAGLLSRVTGTELGVLLGWMSGRVLGQYDVLVAGGPDAPASTDLGPGAVYLVGPNLATLERRHRFPGREFHLWVALHELTHRAQFEGVPWLRPHFLGLARQALSMAETDPARIAQTARSLVTDRGEVRRRLDEGGMAAVLASPEQQQALQAIGGMMALLEGHGDITMDRAGKDHLPEAERFATTLRARRTASNPAVRLLRRLIGLEAKLAQYQLGERFVERVEERAGPRAVDRAWERPEHLPTLDEIRDPDRWLTRLDIVGAA